LGYLYINNRIMVLGLFRIMLVLAISSSFGIHSAFAQSGTLTEREYDKLIYQRNELLQKGQYLKCYKKCIEIDKFPYLRRFDCGMGASEDYADGLFIKLECLDSLRKYDVILYLIMDDLFSNREIYAEAYKKYSYYLKKTVKILHPEYKRQLKDIDYFNFIKFYATSEYEIMNKISFFIWNFKINIDYYMFFPQHQMIELYNYQNNKEEVNRIFHRYFINTYFYRMLFEDKLEKTEN
jgi:hypothetical protein